MGFLLQLPSPISFLIVSASATLLTLTGLYLVRKKYSADVLKENHEVTAIIFNAFGLFYGVMLAFVVFVTWGGYSDATKDLEMEANLADDLFHIAQTVPDPAKTTMERGLVDYINSVFDELQRMSGGEIEIHSTGVMSRLLTQFYQIDESSFPNKQIYAEALSRLNNLAEYRRLRIFTGNDTVPSVVWLVLLVGAVFTVCFNYLFGMKNIRAQYLITATLTITMSQILFLIFVLDHPFTGSSRISTEPLKQVMEVMQKEKG
jgi:ABC-type multidrug transport system fused ATPase/permease subunit